MKKVFFYFLATIFLFNFTGCATTRTMSNFLSAKSYLDSGEYDKAIIACQEALESNHETPLKLKLDGQGGINADYFARICLGASYGFIGDIDKAEDNMLKAIPLFPDKAFFSYLLLSDLYYKYNKIDKAYRCALKAKETVGTARYYEMMKKSALAQDRDIWVDAVDAAIAFYELRSTYKDLEQQLAIANKKKAIQLATNILNKKYKVHFGANGHDTVIDFINKGGMADLNGLMIADKILMINNAPVENEKAGMHELAKLMTQYGNTVIYKIERQGRNIEIETQLVYPEVEAAKRILADLKSNQSDSYKHIVKADSKGPWIKILEPKAARGVKIISNQKASFVILASGSNKITMVTVNGVKCNNSDADALEKTFLLEPDNINKYTIDLPLAQGRNKFVIMAIDARGNKTKKDIEIDGNQTFSKKMNKLYDRKVAVIIGINKYNNSEYEPLDFAIRDAQAIKEQIVKMGFDKVIEIPEANATRAGILRVLADELPYILGQNDALFVYFAGHGDTEELKGGEMEGYILPRDAKKKNYRGTAISMEKIREVIKRYKAKHILLVFDSCYSGYGAIPKTVNKSSHPHDTVQIITAGGKNETAGEDSKLRHGIFTKTILDAFSNKSLYSDDGIILASDIGHFVKKEVSRQTDGKQNPQFRYIEGEGDFKFGNFD